MHIPTADTDTLELLPFREALEKSGQRGDYDAARWLYVPDFYTDTFSVRAGKSRSSASA